MITAIVLAGGAKKGLLESDKDKIVNEAFIPLGNRLMIDYVVDALKKSKSINDLVLAGPVDELQKLYAGNPGFYFASSGRTVVETLINALACMPDKGEYILAVTADVPLLTAQAVDDFILSCRQRQGDLYYPVVSKASNESKYPGTVRTYVRLKEGVFTGGNLLLLKSEIVAKCAAKAEELVKLRKEPLKLVSYLGYKTLVRYLLHRLSIQDAEKVVSKLLGIHGICVISPFPEVGIDVDKTSDLELVKSNLLLEKCEYIG